MDEDGTDGFLAEDLTKGFFLILERFFLALLHSFTLLDPPK